MNQRMIVPRVSRDETPFAVIDWSGVPRDDVLSRVRAAVTQWTQTTVAGRIVIADAHGNFNVGDLANECGDPDPTKLLRQLGFSHFEVECFCDTAPSSWQFEYRLIVDG